MLKGIKQLLTGGDNVGDNVGSAWFNPTDALLRTDASTVPTIAATTEAKDMHAIEPEIAL